MNAADPTSASDENRLRPEDRAVHDWYRFVLSFPPHLVRAYLDRFGLKRGQRVLDPFCGTGTTLVECKKLAITSVGVERNPMAHLATQTKLDWGVDPGALLDDANAIAVRATAQLRDDGIEDDCPFPRLARNGAPGCTTAMRSLPEEAAALLLKESISPRPLHKVLVLLEALERNGRLEFRCHEMLALAHVIVYQASNLHFGPEVGIGSAQADAAVIQPWLKAVRAMAGDLRGVTAGASIPATVYRADARRLDEVIEPNSVDAVITSPPYPNEKDYTRTTRLESVILGLIRNKAELRALKQELVRSNTRSVYRLDTDDALVADNPEIRRIAREIERRRIALGKTSGFERMYARVTRLYFGGMSRHLASLLKVLRPGAQLAYVVGDQASYLRVMIRTGEILANIARGLGYEVENIDLFRTRLSTATRAALREEVLVLRLPKRR
jgi:SAM-dependent methyltransferase